MIRPIYTLYLVTKQVSKKKVTQKLLEKLLMLDFEFSFLRAGDVGSRDKLMAAAAALLPLLSIC